MRGRMMPSDVLLPHYRQGAHCVEIRPYVYPVLY